MQNPNNMITLLKEKLRAYLQHNNPDVLVDLQADLSVSQYLEDKVTLVMPFVLEMLSEGRPGYIIEELALNAMTEELKPSRFLYLQEILETEFPDAYAKFIKVGVLTYETLNLLETCKEIFELFSFNIATKDNRFLRYAIIAKVSEHLN